MQGLKVWSEVELLVSGYCPKFGEKVPLGRK
jgi:hypothetical protein